MRNWFSTLLNNVGFAGEPDSTLRHSVGYAVVIFATAVVTDVFLAVTGIDPRSAVFAVAFGEFLHAVNIADGWRRYGPRWVAIIAAVALAGVLLGVL